MSIPIPVILVLAALLPFSTYAQKNTPDTAIAVPAQNNLATADNISAKSLGFVGKKYTGLTNSVDSQTVRMLQRMQRREAKLQKKLQGIDSTKAQQVFANSAAQYQQLQAKLQAPFNSAAATNIKQYLPGLDSMGTVMHFLSANNNIPSDKLAQIQGISNDAQQLQARMQQAGDAQAFIQQREQQLQSQLGQYGSLSGQLLGMNKEAYYYQQQLQQYKDLINDPEKLGEAILSKVSQLPAFQSFWQKNSILAQLFPQPENFGTAAALAGLQTRAQVATIISGSLPSSASGTDPSQFLSQQFQQAQSQMNTIKDKLSQLGGNGSGTGDMTMPNFTPNTQHNKSFLKRLTYGFDLQNSPATTLLPAISTLGVSLGYKLSDKAVIGTGASYQLGLGTGFSHIAFTNQGVGLRSYAELRLPQPKGRGWQWLGSLWATGGYEYNYMQAFAKFSDLGNVDVWQKSALLGITKKYKVGRSECSTQLLYDFLAHSQVPQGQALKFRIGYGF